jgi:hypothetical protein
LRFGIDEGDRVVAPVLRVRVTEGFIYNDAIVAIEPEVERAASIVALLLDS